MITAYPTQLKHRDFWLNLTTQAGLLDGATDTPHFEVMSQHSEAPLLANQPFLRRYVAAWYALHPSVVVVKGGSITPEVFHATREFWQHFVREKRPLESAQQQRSPRKQCVTLELSVQCDDHPPHLIATKEWNRIVTLWETRKHVTLLDKYVLFFFFFTSSLLHFFTSSLLHFFTSSLLHFFTSSLLHFFTSSLLHFFTSSLSPNTTLPSHHTPNRQRLYETRLQMIKQKAQSRLLLGRSMLGSLRVNTLPGPHHQPQKPHASVAFTPTEAPPAPTPTPARVEPTPIPSPPTHTPPTQTLSPPLNTSQVFNDARSPGSPLLGVPLKRATTTTTTSQPRTASTQTHTNPEIRCEDCRKLLGGPLPASPQGRGVRVVETLPLYASAAGSVGGTLVSYPSHRTRGVSNVTNTTVVMPPVLSPAVPLQGLGVPGSPESRLEQASSVGTARRQGVFWTAFMQEWERADVGGRGEHRQHQYPGGGGGGGVGTASYAGSAMDSVTSSAQYRRKGVRAPPGRGSVVPPYPIHGVGVAL